MLDEDATATAAALPEKMRQDITAGEICFTGDGTVTFGFEISERRVPLPTPLTREAARESLNAEMSRRLEQEWVKDWLHGSDDEKRYLRESYAEEFRETCPTCEGDLKENCPACSATGKKDCPDWDCRYGKKDCRDCEGHGKPKCQYCYGTGSVSAQVPVSVSQPEGGYRTHYEMRTLTCKHCFGAGRSGICFRCSFGKVDCGTCRGTAKVSCKDCSGSGQITCRDCVGNGEVGIEMRLAPDLRKSISRTPDDQEELFRFCSEHVPGYLSQKSACQWTEVTNDQDGANGTFRFRSSASHAEARRKTARGDARVLVGHETEDAFRNDQYRWGLAERARSDLEGLAFDDLREYPLGKDVLRRVVTGRAGQGDFVSEYRIQSELDAPIAEAGRSMKKYLQKGEWAYYLAFCLVAVVTGLLQSSPGFLVWAGDKLTSLGIAPLSSTIWGALFYSPWLVMIVSVIAMLQVRRRRAFTVLGENAKLSSRAWSYAVPLMLAAQIGSVIFGVYVSTPISSARQDDLCASADRAAECVLEAVIHPAVGFSDRFQSLIYAQVESRWPETPLIEDYSAISNPDARPKSRPTP